MSSFLITDVRIFDGEAVIDSGSVLIKNGKIAKVSTTPISFTGKTISKPGHTLLPGLIDAHVHIDFGSERGLEQALRFGVTTQCDLGNAPFQIQKLKEMVKKGDCSDLKAAMQSATPEGGWPTPLLEKKGINLPPPSNPLRTSEDGRNFVREQVQNGADYIKLLHETGSSFGMHLPTLSPETGSSFGMHLPTLSPAVQRSIISSSHISKKIVLAHAFSIKDALEVLSLGSDGMAHSTVSPPTPELIAAYQLNKAFCIPTLPVIGSSTAEGRRIQRRFADDPRVQDLLLVEGSRENMCQCIAMTDKQKGSLSNAVETVKQLKNAGIDIICGTDSAGLAPGTSYGLSLHQELSQFVSSCKFTPIEALGSATSITARRFKFNDRGWIREGLRADLVLVEGDPTTDIDCTLNLRGVWSCGKLCSYYEGKV